MMTTTMTCGLHKVVPTHRARPKKKEEKIKPQKEILAYQRGQKQEKKWNHEGVQTKMDMKSSEHHH